MTIGKSQNRKTGHAGTKRGAVIVLGGVCAVGERKIKEVAILKSDDTAHSILATYLFELSFSFENIMLAALSNQLAFHKYKNTDS